TGLPSSTSSVLAGIFAGKRKFMRGIIADSGLPTKRRPVRSAQSSGGWSRASDARAVPAFAVARAIAVLLAHEAVELLAVTGHAEVPHILVEGVDLLVEALALLFEPAELLGAVLIEGSIAALRAE